MAKTIAISGKGGTGKTTLAAMMIRSLIDRSDRAVLAVDADANSSLGLTLGTSDAKTVAELREESLKKKAAPDDGLSRIETFRYGFEQLIVESRGFDLLTMGRPEGPDCYCAVNNVLRKALDELSSSYGFVVLDNEAGMEHLSRRTTNNVDWLIVVGEPTAIGRLTVERIIELAGSLPISVGRLGVLWNRSDDPIDMAGATTLGAIPYDQAVMAAAMAGESIFTLDKSNAALSAVRNIIIDGLEI